MVCVWMVSTRSVVNVSLTSLERCATLHCLQVILTDYNMYSIYIPPAALRGAPGDLIGGMVGGLLVLMLILLLLIVVMVVCVRRRAQRKTIQDAHLQGNLKLFVHLTYGVAI